ncbi:MAG: hypothetical protein J6O23_03715 [Prevotella sp.]|nr:hypothetical protein [Prevotella sp.]
MPLKCQKASYVELSSISSGPAVPGLSPDHRIRSSPSGADPVSTAGVRSVNTVMRGAA